METVADYAMKRLSGWFTYLALNIIVMASVIDDFSIGYKKTVDYVLGIATFSIILSIIYISGHFSVSFIRNCMGNLFELVVTIISCILWTVAICIVQSPKERMATAVEEDFFNFTDTVLVGGQEVILNANLYFFSWFAYFCSVYQVGSIFHDISASADESIIRWFLLASVSIVIIANNKISFDLVCRDDDGDGHIDGDGMVCGRTEYAIGAGCGGTLVAYIMIFMNLWGKNLSPKCKFLLHVFSSFLMTVLYLVGVALLTSSNGPAKQIGNTYFSAWGGFAVSSMLFFQYAYKRLTYKEEMKHELGSKSETSIV